MIKAEKTVRVSLRNVDRLGQVDWKTNEWPRAGKFKFALRK